MTKPLDDKIFLSSYFIVAVIQSLKWPHHPTLTAPMQRQKPENRAQDTLVLMFAKTAQTIKLSSLEVRGFLRQGPMDSRLASSWLYSQL